MEIIRFPVVVVVAAVLLAVLLKATMLLPQAILLASPIPVVTVLAGRVEAMADSVGRVGLFGNKHFSLVPTVSCLLDHRPLDALPREFCPVDLPFTLDLLTGSTSILKPRYRQFSVF
jgi:hypothetical protein